ncbi:MAG: His/Gly/Thr/Pro-type tRNA ligase C-terminal domain-containing protein, partial [Candidatus Baltobacteraceae bacterium]
LGAEARARLVPFVAQLRAAAAMPVFIDFGDRKLLAHLKTADRNNARYALILGSEELAQAEIVLRDLVTREDRRMPLASGKDTAAALVEVRT